MPPAAVSSAERRGESAGESQQQQQRQGWYAPAAAASVAAMPHKTAVAGGPVPTTARQGRDNQKYGVDGERLVAGTIPVRFRPGGPPGPEGVEVLLISSRGAKGHLCFPKGGWERDESVEQAARRETVEEAGVRGELELPVLGAFPFHSSSHQNAHRGRCLAHIYVLHVSEELPIWPEGEQRTRHWCTLQEACGLCRHGWMREALVVWMQRRGWHAAIPPALAAQLELQRRQQQQQQQQQQEGTAGGGGGGEGGQPGGGATAGVAAPSPAPAPPLPPLPADQRAGGGGAEAPAPLGPAPPPLPPPQQLLPPDALLVLPERIAVQT